ncbi:TPA: farnesyl-diphosphate synthase, partial [Streptococcus suis]
SELDRGKYSILDNLLNKYNILDLIKKEIYCIELDIQNNLNILGETMNVQRLSFFIDYAINLAKTRASIK